MGVAEVVSDANEQQNPKNPVTSPTESFFLLGHRRGGLGPKARVHSSLTQVVMKRKTVVPKALLGLAYSCVIRNLEFLRLQ